MAKDMVSGIKHPEAESHMWNICENVQYTIKHIISTQKMYKLNKKNKRGDRVH